MWACPGTGTEWGSRGSSGRSQTREAGEPGCSAGLNVRPQNRNQYASQPRKILAPRKPHWGSGAARVQAHLQEAAAGPGPCREPVTSSLQQTSALPLPMSGPWFVHSPLLSWKKMPTALVSFHHPWSILSLLTPDFFFFLAVLYDLWILVS